MRWRPRHVLQLLPLCVAALLFSQCSHAPTEKVAAPLTTEQLSDYRSKDMVFIYVHGFGEGGKQSIPFDRALKQQIAREQLNAAVIAYQWDSSRIAFHDIFDAWDAARDRADRSGAHLYRTVIAPLEESRTPYCIIGYSLGTRVVADALNGIEKPLTHLRGITFVGSALNSDVELDLRAIPTGLTLKNYYSPAFDYVLKTSFHVAEGARAAGAVGFADHPGIVNYRTVCTHAYKGSFLQRDYSDLAAALIEMSYFEQGLSLPRREAVSVEDSAVLAGRFQWSDIVLQRRQSGHLLIQHNANSNSYRVVAVGSHGSRRCRARSQSLYALLRHCEERG